LVNMLGGQIHAESQLGHGSTFTFALNLERQAEKKSKQFVIASALQGLNVLVVDHHLENQKFLKKVLESFSFHVMAEDSAEAGLTRLEQQAHSQPFDLVLLNRSLPGNLDGLEALQRIRQHPQLSKTPAILLISASEMVHQADEIGPDGYLIKPITRSQLFDAIMLIFGDKLTTHGLTSQFDISASSLDKLRDAHVLLVEDNEINQLVAKEMLQNLGLEVTVAGSGEKALQILQEEHFDAVLMDIQMPGMDGYQTTAQIRTDPRFTFTNLPIIAITAHALLGDREKVLDAGLNDYVTKPIDLAQLTTALLNWITPHPAPGVRLRSESGAVQPGQAQQPFPSAAPGFALEQGLARLEGNRELYMRLLLMFQANYTGVVREMRVALAQDDLGLARRLAHTLKGVSANISAVDLSAAAKTLEANFAEDQLVDREAQLAETERQLAIAISAITSLAQLEKTVEPPTGPAKDVSILSLLNNLAHLLSDSDAEALHSITALMQQTHAHDLRDELGVLEQMIRRFEFENALQGLQDLAQKRGFPLDKV
jgi:two-component system, sensor histidine kinase and response regulator